MHGRRLMLLALKEAEFMILCHKQFLGRRCGNRKNCWLDDDYTRIWQDVRALCALLLYILQFLK